MKEVLVGLAACCAIILFHNMSVHADCTGCAPGKSYEHLFTPDGKPVRIVPTSSRIVLTIRPDGTIERRGKPLEYVEREELIAIIGELMEFIQKGK